MILKSVVKTEMDRRKEIHRLEREIMMIEQSKQSGTVGCANWKVADDTSTPIRKVPAPKKMATSPRPPAADQPLKKNKRACSRTTVSPPLKHKDADCNSTANNRKRKLFNINSNFLDF